MLALVWASTLMKHSMNNLTHRISRLTVGAGIGALFVSLIGCSALNTPVSASAAAANETLSYAVGPCFGFCPVYSLEVSPAGHVAYVGERHTAVIGPKEREAGEKAYDRAAEALAAFRPADGATKETECEQRRTDAQHYVITWAKPDGTKTILRHDRGCISAKNTELNKVLDGLPAQLGASDWAKQQTDPGASRG